MANWIERLKTKAHLLRGEAYALYLAYRHPSTPWYAKVFAAVVVAYAFSPIDLIPDFVPILGYLDDLILIPLGITLALKMIPQNVIIEAQQQARLELEEDKPKRWLLGVVFIMIWLTLIILVIRRVLGWRRDFRGG